MKQTKEQKDMISTGTTIAILGAATVGAVAGGLIEKQKASHEISELKETNEKLYNNKGQNRDRIQQMENSAEEAEILIRKLRRQNQEDSLTIQSLKLKVSEIENQLSAARLKLSNAGIDPND